MHGQLICIESDLWICGRLVGTVHTCEVADVSLQRLLIKAFGVSMNAGFQGCGNMHFVKTMFSDDVPRPFPVGGERRYEGAYDYHSGVIEKSAEFGYASDVFLPSLAGEVQIAVDPHAGVVAVDDVGVYSLLVEPFVDGRCQGTFTGSRQSGEPDGKCGMSVFSFPFLSVHSELLVKEVRPFLWFFSLTLEHFRQSVRDGHPYSFMNEVKEDLREQFQRTDADTRREVSCNEESQQNGIKCTHDSPSDCLGKMPLHSGVLLVVVSEQVDDHA